MAVVEGIIVAVWWWRRDPRSARAIWIGAAICGVLLFLSYMVVTPTEQIVRLCHRLARLAKAEDIAGLEAHLSDGLSAGQFDRATFLDRAETTLERFDIDHAKLRAFEVNVVDRDRGTAEFNAICRISAPNFLSNMFISRWRLTFVRWGESWRVDKIEVVPTAFSPIRHVRDCFR